LLQIVICEWVLSCRQWCIYVHE